jgi:hypothetical protein
MRPVFSILAAAVLVPCAAVQGQSYSGTFTTANNAGGTVTLVMVQSAQGQVTGSLSGAGVSYELNGIIDRCWGRCRLWQGESTSPLSTMPGSST